MFRILVITLVLCASVSCFPNGAPADTCVRSRSNEPNHGAARTQSLETLPYQVVASSDQYQPGKTIHVTISGNDIFRGFFFQARDAETDEWIGNFQESPNTKAIPECSSITHGDNKDKSAATLIWQAPQDKSGRVYFTGAIVKNYSTFWSQIVAQIPAQETHQ